MFGCSPTACTQTPWCQASLWGSGQPRGREVETLLLGPPSSSSRVPPAHLPNAESLGWPSERNSRRSRTLGDTFPNMGQGGPGPESPQGIRWRWCSQDPRRGPSSRAKVLPCWGPSAVPSNPHTAQPGLPGLPPLCGERSPASHPDDSWPPHLSQQGPGGQTVSCAQNSAWGSGVERVPRAGPDPGGHRPPLDAAVAASGPTTRPVPRPRAGPVPGEPHAPVTCAAARVRLRPAESSTAPLPSGCCLPWTGCQRLAASFVCEPGPARPLAHGRRPALCLPWQASISPSTAGPAPRLLPCPRGASAEGTGTDRARPASRS